MKQLLDKIELFTKNPETAEVWASGNEHEIWKKMPSPRVRERLGRNSLDPVYKYFSEEGAHAPFTAMRPRLRKKSGGPEEAPEIAIMIGGMKDPTRQKSILIYCIQLGGQAIAMTQRAFADRFHDLDIANMVTKLTSDTNALYNHFLDSFDRSSVDMEPLKPPIAVLQRMHDCGEI
jgi:hypothetical protein